MIELHNNILLTTPTLPRPLTSSGKLPLRVTDPEVQEGVSINGVLELNWSYRALAMLRSFPWAWERTQRPGKGGSKIVGGGGRGGEGKGIDKYLRATNSQKK